MALILYGKKSGSQIFPLNLRQLGSNFDMEGHETTVIIEGHAQAACIVTASGYAAYHRLRTLNGDMDRGLMQNRPGVTQTQIVGSAQADIEWFVYERIPVPTRVISWFGCRCHGFLVPLGIW